MANGTAKWKGQNVQQDENNRLVTDTQIASWDNKEDGFVLLEDGYNLTNDTPDGKYKYMLTYDSNGNLTNPINIDGQAITSYSNIESWINISRHPKGSYPLFIVRQGYATYISADHLFFSYVSIFNYGRGNTIQGPIFKGEQLKVSKSSKPIDSYQEYISIFDGTVDFPDSTISDPDNNYLRGCYFDATGNTNTVQLSLGKSYQSKTDSYPSNMTTFYMESNLRQGYNIIGGGLDLYINDTLHLNKGLSGNITFKLNGGTTEGSNLFTYNGSKSIVINITPANIGAAAASDIPTTLPASDVSDWAKAATKPTYTFAEITEKPDTYTPSAHTHKDSDIESISADKITGTIGIDHLPKGALERLVPVANDEARFKLTTDDVQLGDTVKVEDTGLMYYVVDESKLSEEAGYAVYTAGAATSVPWSGVTDKPDTFEPSEHNHNIEDVTGLQLVLDNKALRNHKHVVAEITDFPSAIKNPNALSIQLNGGTANTYDGSSAKSIDITPTAIGAATESHTHDSVAITDWDTAITSGSYYALAAATNNPTADAAYSGTVVKGATIVTQEVVKETADGDLYKYFRRGQLNDARTAVTAWGNWQEVHYVAG